MFRRPRSQHLDTFTRSDVSLVSEVVGYLATARADGLPVAPDELPIAVGAATLHSDTISAMPARSRAASVPPRVAHLLERPDPGTDYRATIASTVLAMFWHGYSPWLLDKPAPFTTTVTTIDPRRASWDRVSDVWTIGGKQVPGDRIYCVTLIDDPCSASPGVSPLRRCWQALSMYGYAYRHLIDYFAQGGNPMAILKSQTRLGNIPDADGVTPATQIVNEWITARQTRRPAVMDPDISLEVPANNGELAATLGVLDHGAAEVARLLNMPASLVNAPTMGSSLNYANVQDELRRWIALSLAPSWMSRIESAFREITGDPTIYLDPTELLAVYVALSTNDAVMLPDMAAESVPL